MAKVTCLQYDEYRHAASGVRFERTRVRTGAGDVYLGVAEVPDDVARQHFLGRDAFRVDGLAPEDPSAEQRAAEQAAAETGASSGGADADRSKGKAKK